MKKLPSLKEIHPRWIEPLVLEGDHVVLEPLEPNHVDALIDAARDGELWKLWYTSPPSPETAQAYVDDALAMFENRSGMPFVVRKKSSGKIIGSTRFCRINEAHQRAEIGYTWYSKRVQRTAVNTECKRLLLGHAFDTLDAIAIELRTHFYNQPSRRAIERLGAKLDGVLRNHRKMPAGGYRDTVVYSILNSEWPVVKRNLDFKLGLSSLENGA